MALLLTGCALPRTLTETERPAETPAEVAWQRDLPLAGGVITTDEVAVTYTATEDGELTLLGLSTADGSTVWEHEAGRGAVQPSLSRIQPAAFSDENGVYVGFLEEDTRSTSTRHSSNRVSIVDVATGEIVARTTERTWIYTSPEECADRPAVCMRVYDGDRPFRAYLGVESTDLLEHPQQASAREGDVTAQSHSDGDWTVSRLPGGGSEWSVRLSALPGVPPHAHLRMTTPAQDSPWRLIETRDAAVVHGKEVEYREVVDLRDHHLYLLDADTGDVLWWGSGYVYSCPYDLLIAGVRCAASGVEHRIDGPNEYENLDLTLEGFADDGSTAWTLPLGADALPLTAQSPSSFSEELLVPTNDGVLLLDPTTGGTRTVPATWTYLCGQQAEIGHRFHWDSEMPAEDTWFGGALYTACAADGTESDGPPSEAAVVEVGAGAGTVTLVSHPGRLVAYDITD